MKMYIITITWKDGTRVESYQRSSTMFMAIAEAVRWAYLSDDEIIEISAVIVKED